MAMVALDVLAGVSSWTVSVQIGFLAAAQVEVIALTASSFCPVLNNSSNSLLSLTLNTVTVPKTFLKAKEVNLDPDVKIRDQV